MYIFLLVMMLDTRDGPVSYTQEFQTQWQCETRKTAMLREYPGSTGDCLNMGSK